MKDDWVVLRLPPELLMSLRALAQEAGVTPGQYLRDHVARKAESAGVRPDAIPRPASPGVSMLRELVSDILFLARDWRGMQEALVAEGFALRVKGLGLMLHAWPSDEPICRSADLGFSYAELIRRLGAGEPPAPESRPAHGGPHAGETRRAAG